MATSKISKNLQDIIIRSVESDEIEFIANTAKSVDIPIPSVGGYKFVTALNPGPLGNFGGCWITINSETFCRVWTIPRDSNTNKIRVDVLYVKG